MAMSKCRECGTEVSDEAKTCPKCGVSKPVKKTSIVVKIVIAIIGLSIFGNIISNMGSGVATQPKNSVTATEPVKVINPKEKALASVKLEKWEGRKGGFDNVMLLTAKIKNDGDRDVKDIEIECTHASNSGTRIDSNKKIVYELVKAGKTVSIKDFGMGFIHSQATSSSCSIIDLTVL